MASDALVHDAPNSRPSTSGQHMATPINGVKRSFTHLDEGKYEDPRYASSVTVTSAWLTSTTAVS